MLPVIRALSGLGILLVVVGHSIGVTPATKNDLMRSDELYNLFIMLVDAIYIFHMPLFFAISGYLFAHSTYNKNCSFVDILYKKFMRLLLPYVAITCVTYPLKVIFSQFAIRPLSFSFIDYCNALLFPWNNPIIFFWFLPTLFLMFIFAKLFFFIENKSVQLVLLSMQCLFFLTFSHQNNDGVYAFFNLGGALHNLIYFYLGFIASKTNVLKKSNFTYSSCVMFMVGFLFLYGILIRFSIDNGLFILLVTCNGILLCYNIASLIPGYFNRLGDYSYQIYLLSWFPTIFIRITLGQVFFVNIWLSVISTIIFSILIPIAVALLINKSRFTPLKKIVGL